MKVLIIAYPDDLSQRTAALAQIMMNQGHQVHIEAADRIKIMGNNPDFLLLDEIAYAGADFQMLPIRGMYDAVLAPVDKRKQPKGPRSRWGKLK